MDGPDLSHLLDDAGEKPPSEVLDGIVRRHRRLRARRARMAASLGLVIALAGLGVGIGLNNHGGTTTTASGTVPGDQQFKANNQAPSKTTALPGPFGKTGSPSVPAAPRGTAPRGLVWVSLGSGTETGSAAMGPVAGSETTVPENASAVGVSSTPTAGVLWATRASQPCTSSGCPSYGPYGTLAGSVLTHLFTRTDDGVTVRAFMARWALAPLDLVPVASGSGAASLGKSASGSAEGRDVTGASGTSIATSTSRVPSSSPTVTATPGTTAPTPVSSTPVGPPPTRSDTTTTFLTKPGSVTSPSTVVLPGSCDINQALIVEVSDVGAVGTVTVPVASEVKEPIGALSDEVVGSAERAPMVVVVAHTSDQTATVRAEFAGGGQDEMTVVDGWAVLVHMPTQTAGGGSASQGTATMSGQAEVYALSGEGTVLEHADLPGSGALALPVAACYDPGRAMSKVAASAASGPPATARSGSSSSRRTTPSTTQKAG